MDSAEFPLRPLMVDIYNRAIIHNFGQLIKIQLHGITQATLGYRDYCPSGLMSELNANPHRFPHFIMHDYHRNSPNYLQDLFIFGS